MLSTLLSLMVLIGVVTLTQSLALANTKVIKRLTAAHQEALARDAARALTRPAVAEAMVRFEEAAAARFFDTPHLVEFAGEQVEVVVSVVEESASGQPVFVRISIFIPSR
ncbi:hypothetical protein K3X48_04155 [Aliiroseovarius crassostreae]|uniref:Uncharacterized protein n=1 Tax=Aliiroseovarius crassostreae TaxID=154981 RepID=A0A9Q9H9S7_9RHOB|nr:hypothetical protein [Aliiroseovarius crassostreae]UWP96189.1 hypothetical protein K3X48_04155 [Aliiroseovarius crassostreae]